MIAGSHSLITVDISLPEQKYLQAGPRFRGSCINMKIIVYRVARKRLNLGVHILSEMLLAASYTPSGF